MSCQTMFKAGYQLGIKSEETNFFSDPDVDSAPTLLLRRSGEKSKVKTPPMFRPFRARNDCKNKNQIKNTLKKQMLLL
jgi:hypothetical protein